MITLRIVGLAFWLGVLAYLINPAWMVWAQIQLPAWLRLTGAALGIITDGPMYWVFSSLGNNATPTIVTCGRHELVTTGPYRWVRHPFYSVGFLTLFAVALLAANIYLAMLAIGAFIMISARVPMQEEALLARNGDAYREYARHTGRFLPKVG